MQSQKETHLPTIIVRGGAAKFRGCTLYGVLVTHTHKKKNVGTLLSRVSFELNL